MYSPSAQSICRFFTSSARLRRIRDTPRRGGGNHTKKNFQFNTKHSYATENGICISVAELELLNSLSDAHEQSKSSIQFRNQFKKIVVEKHKQD